MKRCTCIIPAISLQSSTETEQLVRAKRELKNEEVHKLCKKFAALCEDSETTLSLNIEQVIEQPKELQLVFIDPSLTMSNMNESTYSNTY
jgi:hypothetical protein